MLRLHKLIINQSFSCRYIISACSLFLAFIGCKHSPEGIPILDELELHTGYNPKGINFFHHKGDTGIYCYNYATAKKVTLFDLDGRKKDSIDLSVLTNKVGSVWDATFTSGFFFAIGETGIVFQINMKGEILREIDLTKITPSLLGDDKFGFTNLKSTTINDTIRVFVSPYWSSPTDHKKQNYFQLLTNNDVKVLKIQKNNTLKNPLTLELKITDTVLVEKHLTNIYSILGDTSLYGITFNRPVFRVFKEKLLLKSYFSNKIVEYDFIQKRAKIHQLKYNGLPYVNEGLRYKELEGFGSQSFYEKYVYGTMRRNSYILYVIPNLRDKTYVVVLKHETNKQDEVNFLDSKKTLLYCDKDFNILKSYEIEKDKVGFRFRSFGSDFFIVNIASKQVEFGKVKLLKLKNEIY